MSDLTSQLIDRVKTAVEQKQSLIIEGQGTKRHLGRVIDPRYELISVANHSGIVQYQPAELFMTARAGTTLAEIDAALEENKQMLACEPARYDGRATIAGSLAANQAGPGRPWWGSLRDHVLGVNLINGVGERLKFGGQVMKNVAGYDVSRLQAGAMGTLGLITEISFKVMPKPAASATLTRPIPVSDALQAMNELATKSKPISAIAWVDGTLYLRVSGAFSAVDGMTKTWQGDVLPEQEASGFWQQLRDQKLNFFTNGFEERESALWRFSINAMAPTFTLDHPWLFDWSGSLRWLKGDFEHQELQQWAAANGGEVVRWRCHGRDHECHLQTSPALKKIQRNLKKSFDPHGVFNIGRLYSWM